jgi:hypothetical protein
MLFEWVARALKYTALCFNCIVLSHVLLAAAFVFVFAKSFERACTLNHPPWLNLTERSVQRVTGIESTSALGLRINIGVT